MLVPNSRVLVKRARAIGDTIMATPITQRLRFLLGNESRIDVQTNHPEVFYRNPHVNMASVDRDPLQYDTVIDLNEAYEQRPEIHPIDAYMERAFGDSDWPSKGSFLYRAPVPHLILPRFPVRSVVLHPGKSWSRNRTMKSSFWISLIELLGQHEYHSILVGTASDHQIVDDWLSVGSSYSFNILDMVGRLSISQVAWVVSRAACFVSCDMGLFHVAGTTDTPIVAIFTTHLPKLRMPWRAGILGWRVTALQPDLPCVGCSDTGSCRRADFACVESAAVSAEAVMKAIISHTIS